jgi:hypothetical protein
MLSDELIKKLKDDPYVQQYMEYVVGEIFKLDSVQDLSKFSARKAGETARARAIAINMLKDILSPLIDFSEKREPTKEEIKEANTRFGLS